MKRKNLKNQWWKTLSGSPKTQELFKLGARKFHLLKYKKPFKSGVLSFLSSESSFLKYKEFFRVPFSWNIRTAFFWETIRNFVGVFVSWSIRNFLGWIFLFFKLGLKSAGFQFRKYKNFFNISARKFHFLKYKKFFSWWIFFVFRAWAF